MIQPYFNELVGRGSFFAELVEFVRRCSGSSDPALISGETGTGKEAAARSIHLSSNRKNHPFLVVDCSLYYERELERELFGDEMGGGASVRKGILEFSTKGTCYLANIEELSPSIQERLYNYLATGYLQRVGSDRPVSSRVRIIVSSDKDLRGFAEGGLFSAELFGCLEGLQLKTIPLRRHPEDIRPFTRHLLKLYSLEHSGTNRRRMARPQPRHPAQRTRDTVQKHLPRRRRKEHDSLPTTDRSNAIPTACLRPARTQAIKDCTQ